jgi:endonuclease YncB( thermonuclease family)
MKAWKRRLGALAGLAAAAIAVPLAAAVPDSVAGVATVVDGDTLELHGVRVRLHGIDAPESAQTCSDRRGKQWRCGQQAALALAHRIGRSTVTCTRTDTDRYGRMVARCATDLGDINGWLVAEGWAVAYRSYAKDYVAAEERARAARKRIWSGSFEMPWDWRRGPAVARVETERDGCDIKGNISQSGDRIFHLPGGRSYERTKVNEKKGERWFCSEQEARAAGWRRSAQ